MSSRELTLFFTDIEGSTRLWEAHFDEMNQALARHDELLRSGVAECGGTVFKMVGDAVCAVFDRPADAVRAAVRTQQRLITEQWPGAAELRVRMALHTGTVVERDDDYFGPSVNRVARLLAVGHGRQILVSQSVALLVHDALPDIELADLGEHRLKDLSRPEHIFAVRSAGLPSDFPPLRSLDDPAVRHNLPLQTSSFVGRTRELEQVRRLLSEERLLTLVGAGGAGKTRLALQAAAAEVDGSGDGVWLADLSTIHEPELVGQALAGALGLREEAGRPVVETLLEGLGRRSMLLVVDNCEQVVDAVAKLVDRVLRHCPHVVFLCTSREPLRITGEQVYRVPSMSVPPLEGAGPGDVLQADAVTLFVERAQEQQHSFTVDPANAHLVAAICRRLDGIPLAIELATARLRTMSLGDIHDRLDQRFRLLQGGSRTAPSRQQTLRATIDWSYDLLSPAERSLLMRLSVFVGGFDLQAAERVCTDTDTDGDGDGDIDGDCWVLDLLPQLVDKSLVAVDDTAANRRYGLLETVHAYARERLAEVGPGELARLREAHRRHYVERAEAAALELGGDDGVEWLERVEADRGNLRAALDSAARDTGAGSEGLRLVSALRPFWRVRGRVGEDVDLVDAIVARPDAAERSALRVRALTACAQIHWRSNDYRAADALLDEARDIAGELGDDDAWALVWEGDGFVRSRQGDLLGARDSFGRALGCARSSADDGLLGRILIGLSGVVGELGDTAEARALADECLHHLTGLGDRLARAVVATGLSVTLIADGELDRASVSLEEAVDVLTRAGDAYNSATALHNLGLVRVLQDRPAEARSLFVRSLVTARWVNDRGMVPYPLLGQALARTRSGELREAAELHGVADRAARRLDQPFEQLEADLQGRDRDALRAALGAPDFDRLHQSGADLTLEEALDRFDLLG